MSNTQLNLSDDRLSAINKKVTLGIGILFILSWAIVFYDLPKEVGVFLAACIFLIGFRSFYISVFILFLSLVIPFIESVADINLPGMNSTRIYFIPFVYNALRLKPVRGFPAEKLTVLLIIVSFLSIFLSAEIRGLVQDIPVPKDADRSSGWVNLIGRLLDLGIILSFLYFSFTRLSISALDDLFNMLLFLGMMEAMALLFMVVINPSSLGPESITGPNRNLFYLWRNPYFGHKNDWGMVMVIVALTAFITLKFTEKKVLAYITMMVSILALLFSLSRQAYASLILGFILISFLERNIKPAIYLSILLILLIVIQPEFLLNRLDTALSVGSVEDFQGLSRKVGDMAINQFVENLTIVPQMFYSPYEYNWSEGFWNGLTHQTGLIGLVFHIVLYIYLIFRYLSYKEVRDLKTKYLCIMLVSFLITIFISNGNRRGTHLMHYEGHIEQFGFVVLFLIIYTELAIARLTSQRNID